MEQGADVNTHRKRGLPALQRVLYGGRLAVARFLIEKGALDHATPKDLTYSLVHASGRGYPAIVKILTGKGADPDAVTDHGWRRGWSALPYTVWVSAPARFNSLVLLNARPDVNSPKYMWTRTNIICICSDYEWPRKDIALDAKHLEVLKILLAGGASINRRFKIGRIDDGAYL